MMNQEIERRKQEVADYQANIDRMTLAVQIAESQGEDAPEGFIEQLQQLLADNVREQKKSKIMLEVEERLAQND